MVTAMGPFDRITENPEIMGGKACIRSMRVTVAIIVGMIDSGQSADALLGLYPYLDREDIIQALRYTAWLAEGRELSGPRG
jgi:uncharacterized protein (DUF433 family)